MGALLVCLVLIVFLFGAGFALHLLWWVALIGVSQRMTHQSENGAMVTRPVRNRSRTV